MPSDSLIFVDANKYLDLYSMDSGKKLLAPLKEQAEHLFVTQQVVSEVMRNRIEVASTFLATKAKGITYQAFGVPDYPTGAAAVDRSEFVKTLKEIQRAVSGINKRTEQLLQGLLEQISRSADEVSLALAPIFERAVAPSAEEIERAKVRRELGNPPGKYTDPLGDQISWEQILSRCKEKRRIWIISRDADYGIKFLKRGFVNQYLQNELQAAAPGCSVYLFTELGEGLQHFVETTGVTATVRLSPEELDEVEKEESQLPSRSNSRLETLSALERANPLVALASLQDKLNRQGSMFGPIDLLREEVDRQAKMLGPIDLLREEADRQAKMLGPIDLLREEADRQAKMLGPIDLLREEADRQAKMLGPIDLLREEADRLDRKGTNDSIDGEPSPPKAFDAEEIKDDDPPSQD